MTNTLPAEFGRTAGGVLNFIYKSGTNQLHGDFFEFLRNSDLDSNNFFNNRQGLPLATFSNAINSAASSADRYSCRECLTVATSCFSLAVSKVCGQRVA